MSDLALPPHLRGRVHNDWPWPFNRIKRGWNAKGSRPDILAEDYLTWPPKLVEGYDVTRWENTGASSIVFLKDLANRRILPTNVYGKKHKAVETAAGNPNFGKEIEIFIDYWKPGKVSDDPDPNNPGRYIQKCEPNDYSPSALQKFSTGSGYMRLDPLYTAKWKIIKKKEWPWPVSTQVGPLTPEGEDIVFFMRDHNRPDHLDGYYNCRGVVPIGFIGLKWE